ncbi:putative EF-hand calcium-binding domain protein [Aspergillus glaucus CBS 516.65]|uniref:Serine hydrolase domain-containing protein n=1 Tax=Aspergillus glaucus CBS 516.65 TaxID=1160497 RepID=A0A1L9V4I3_ASPGL|nr:hypothetical protein ASPGLDRAFT_1097100 [Aspergillus glaucus CBS 516.65]OJJ78844.1 hypothetical protein ASPGLDRAFT_1097100 [Aspergillus glaucus CBS 516.65]
MMRVLCLHGKGTSGVIFKSQTASFRAHLAPLNIDFDFVDGPIPSSPAPGIDLFYTPPYYSWWEGESAEAIKAARQWLKSHLVLSGPYDAVMMFSQGCTLGSSALLLNALEEPRSPPLFKAAIFICGGPPLAVAETLGYHMSTEMRERDNWSRAALAQQADSSAILSQGAARWRGGRWDISNEEQLRDEMEFPWRVEIPTVHIYGDKDPRYLAGVQLSALFDTDNMKTYAHDGGHEIPRKDVVSRKIAELVRWALESA